MRPKVYIDGQSGTTGLQIHERLAKRRDIELLTIDEAQRRDLSARKERMDTADIVFLCLPDTAAEEAVELIRNPQTRVIDASTVHRTARGWTYGFPELKSGQRGEIASSGRVANPGCHATGFVSTAAPLVQLGILPRDYPTTVYSLTGYSGGGKKMIAEYEAPDRPEELSAPRIYGLTLQHKHLPEMQKVTGLTYPPIFNPVVDDYYKGMATTLLLHNRLLKGTPSAEEIWKALAEFYAGEKLISVMPFGQSGPMLCAGHLAGTDRLEIHVCGNQRQTMVTALFDNLGKGASGAAVQNMNLMLGFKETAGLSL